MKRPTPPDIETQLVIIGAGVTGLTTAKELIDTDIDFWLLGSPFESQLAKAGELEDTSLPEGTVGLKHIEKEFDKLKANGVNHRSSLCTGIEIEGEKFLVKTKFQNFKSEYLLIATGNKQKSLGFDGEAEFFRNGISDCTVCDFPLFRDKPVAVVGNHEYTIRAAKLMRKHTDSVVLLWYKASDAPDLEGIEVFQDVDNLVAKGGESLSSIKFNHASGEAELDIKGLFVEGEPVPSTDYLTGISLDQEDGYIKVDENYQTSMEGIWAAGDITGRSSDYETALQHGKEVANQLTDIVGG